MIPQKTGIPALPLLYIFPPFPAVPPTASPDLIVFHQQLSQWYDELKRVLQNAQG